MPSTRAIASQEISVLGFDVEQAKAAKLQHGEIYIEYIDVEAVRDAQPRPDNPVPPELELRVVVTGQSVSN